MKPLTNMIAAIWERLVGEPFSPQSFAAQLRHDGGHDISNLSESDLMALIEGRFSGDWREVAFSFSELLTFYNAANDANPMTDRQTVGWCFAAMMIAESCRRDVTDWDLQINYLLDGLAHMRRRLEVEEMVELLGRVFGAKCEDPNATNARPEPK